MVGAGAVLLDVRSPAEYAQGHLEGAANIPVQVLAQRVGELGASSKAVDVYCKMGQRSEMAAQILRQAGFKDVFNMISMENW